MINLGKQTSYFYFLVITLSLNSTAATTATTSVRYLSSSDSDTINVSSSTTSYASENERVVSSPRESVVLDKQATSETSATVNGVLYSGFAGAAKNTFDYIDMSYGLEGPSTPSQLKNVASGAISSTSTDAINGSQLYSVINNAGWTVGSQTNGGESTYQANSNFKVKSGSAMNINAGKNIRTSGAGNELTVSVADNPTFSSISIPNGPSMSGSGINMNRQRMSNLSDAIGPTDAVNKRQLDAVHRRIDNMDSRIDDIDRRESRNDKRHRAGIAGATAVAFLQRANQAGKHLVSMSAGHYRDESAVALGYSRAAEDNKISIAVGGAFNTRGDTNVGGSIGYQW